MNIQISGYQGFPTEASIEAYVGMKFLGKTVTKVNKKSIVLSCDSNPHVQQNVIDALRIPFWAISACDLPNVKTSDGQTYQPKQIEQIMHTLCQLDAHDAVSAIAAVAEVFVQANDTRKASVTDNFDEISAMTVFSVVNKLTNC